MTINVEMFKRIEEIITANPEQHDQSYFEDGLIEEPCGTTRCVAGWAIHLWGQDNGLTGRVTHIMRAYIDHHGPSKIIAEQNMPIYGYEEDLHDWIDAEHVGANILGLGDRQSYRLFFNMDNADALRMVKEYARGNTTVE